MLRGFLFFALLTSTFAQAAEPPGDGMSAEKLGDCNWQVSYRGRIYDLSPLTRESLSRPIENDIRFALERVPEAASRLNEMSRHFRDAKTETILASLFISGLVVAKLLEGRSKNDNDRLNYHIAEAATGGFFLTATFYSWRSSVQAKQELVNAVEEFNAHSAYKIEPASGRAGEALPGGAAK
ncbi:MAG: hypothetical protein ACXVCK_11200 [Bdellovibrionota bacterium]